MINKNINNLLFKIIQLIIKILLNIILKNIKCQDNPLLTN